MKIIVKNIKWILSLIILILLFLLIRGCNSKNSTIRKQKELQNRLINNINAKTDSIHTLIKKDGTKVGYKTVYELKYDSLLKQFKSIENKLSGNKNSKPITITKVQYVTRDTIIVYNPITINDSIIYIKDSIIYNKDNKTVIRGEIPYTIDSNNILHPKKSVFQTNTSMDLSLGLFKSKKNGRVQIRAVSGNPNTTFTDIEGVNILYDKKNKELMRGFRKPFGIGLQLGYGFMYSGSELSKGVYIGVGLSYTPKFLQFGD